MANSKKSIEQSLNDKKQKVTEAQDAEKDLQNDLKMQLSDEQKQTFVERVVYLVKKDETDRKEYIDTIKKVRDMYEGKQEPKILPWKNCANVKTQLTNLAVELLHSRLFPSAWNDDLLYWRPQEKTDVENVDNIQKFMKWASRDMKLSSIFDDYIHNLILDGTAILKIRWIVDYKWVQRKIYEPETIGDKIKKITFAFRGGKKDYEVPDRKFKVEYDYKKFETCKAEVINIEDCGFPTYSVPSSNEEELEYIWHRTHPTYLELLEMQSRGYFENVESIGTYLDNILLEGSKKSDIEAEHTQITQNKLNHQCEVIEFYDKYDFNNDGVREDIVITIEKQSKVLLDARPLLAISRINERPFIIGQFIRRPNRMLGKGAGEIAVPFEEEANAIHNQRLDAATMSITPFGVYRAGSGFKPEDIQISPGLMTPVDDVNDAKWMQVPNNLMVSFQEERMLMELLEKILSVGAYQSGQESDTNRSRSTARGTLAIIQQGEIRFAILAKRTQMPLVRALNKILHQWQDKLPPGLAMRVLGEKGDQLFPKGIAPEDIAGNYDAYLVTDSTGGSKRFDQQMKSWIYQNFIMNPFVAQNPSGMWQLSADALIATGVYEDPTLILGEKPVSAPNVKSVQEENILMMEGKEVHPSDMDNVIEHLIGHYNFRYSADFVGMPPEYRLLFDRHLEETKTQLAGATQKMAQGLQQPMQPMQQPMPQQNFEGMTNELGQGEGNFPTGAGGMATPNPANPVGNPAAQQNPMQ